ncbi:MAG: C-GCAxxG-C-C family protein [Spirochaetia bacterium]|jgi:C_GCAxxG_C_C family probable redox protein|nr:C-GCAxxG-C-C family protein [Spirochaetia bacterium]
MTKPEQAVRLHADGSNCAQSVLCAFTSELGIDTVQAHRLATGLGGGLGRRQHLCGAVNGGAMVLGAALGNDTGTDLAAKERTYEAVRAYINAMETEFGSIECRTLLGLDLNSPDGKAAFKERSLSASVCDKLIARCAEEVDRILKDRR